MLSVKRTLHYTSYLIVKQRPEREKKKYLTRETASAMPWPLILYHNKEYFYHPEKQLYQCVGLKPKSFF